MHLRKMLLGFAIAMSLAWSATVAAQNIARNGSCEVVKGSKPASWALYCGFGKVKEWGSLEQGRQGKGVYLVPGDFSTLEKGKRKGQRHINCALVLGDSNGVSGANAFVPMPNPLAKYFRRPLASGYKVSFWVKSEASELKVELLPWRSEKAGGNDRMGMTLVALVPRTEEWTRYERTVTLPGGAKRFALVFLLNGYESDGLRLGRVCVDEVHVEPTSLGLTADDLPRIRIPARPAVFVDFKPLATLVEAYRRGDADVVARVRAALASADAMAAKPDAWYRQFFATFEPRGCYTVTCPIHPFKTRNYNWFQMSLDEPWKLICKHCKAEGRKYYYYPNPDYPDDGSGCAPTDEVWRRTHDAAWTKAHRGIPWDHWDGSCHGEVGGGRAYHFLGHYYERAFQTLIRRHAPTLALAYHYSRTMFPPGSEQYNKADLYAHKAKVILLSAARAHLGDAYLAAAEGMTPAQFQARMEKFYRPAGGGKWAYRKYPGFRPYKYTDAMVGDSRWADDNKKHPYGFRIFHGAWDRRAGVANSLLNSFCLTRGAFAPADDDIARMCQRIVVSLPGDREKVAMGQDPPASYLKRGSFEMAIHPFQLETGGNNLSYATQPPRLLAGLCLRDDRIVENVAKDIMYYFRNFFTQDGLSREGAPSYTYAGYCIVATMDKLYSLKGNFDADAPYFDKALGAINMFRMPEFKTAATRLIYSTTEDGHFIPWEDSYYDYGPILFKHMLDMYARMEKLGGGIPKKEREYLHIDKTADRVSVTRNQSVPLPPVLLHDRRKAVLRAGPAAAPTVAALDFTKKCGHYHPPVQTLVVHACGQELASDLGYLGACHFMTSEWIRTYPAHNCVTLRAADGNPKGTACLRGDLRRNFVVTPFCQLVDTAEYDAADWTDSGFGKKGELSRQILLMVPSAQHQYVVDIARARGGATHDYYLHCHGLGFSVDGIKLAALPDADTDLYQHSGWTFKCKPNWGAKNIHNLEVGRAAGTWRATWSRIDDYRGQPKGKPIIHDDVFMRLWMVDEPGSEVIVGTAPAQRYFRNEDLGRTMKVLCVRRPNTERVDKFVGVIEPYRGKSFVKSVRRLDAGDDGYTVAIAVQTRYGTDYIVSYGGPGAPSAVTLSDRGHTIQTDGDVAVVSFPNSGEPRLLLAGGSRLVADRVTLKTDGPRQWSGRLADFDDAADTLTIECAEPWPAGSTLAGRPIVVQHREDRSSFTIKSVERMADGRCLVRLDDAPHLMNNWLLVRKVTPTGIVVEPPPVLDYKCRTFKIYGGEPGKLAMIGPLRNITSTPVYNEYGTCMARFYAVVTDRCDGVAPGQEIGITRLEKGRDTVSVTNVAWVDGGAAR